MASTAPSCCTLAPVRADYTPKGETVKIGDLDVYLTGSKGAKNSIIINYDIFGMHINVQQVADILSTHGFRVAMPDLFRGNPYPLANFPPKDFSQIWTHVGAQAPFERVKGDIKATQEYLKKEGCANFGLVGFCWGGRNVALLTQDPVFKAGAIVHPGNVTPEEAALVQAPLLVMPAQDDKAEVFDKVVEILRTKPFGSKVVHRRFDDVPHGFCASRSDFGNELMAKRANEAIEEMNKFFLANL
ncbi:hypothetical protein HDV05_004176 [Chytridiales sp. JEL 0842]|nr:hypothetical protein HDV05_004176 [Chytridiales sp. JEL 0842]